MFNTENSSQSPCKKHMQIRFPYSQHDITLDLRDGETEKSFLNYHPFSYYKKSIRTWKYNTTPVQYYISMVRKPFPTVNMKKFLDLIEIDTYDEYKDMYIDT